MKIRRGRLAAVAAAAAAAGAIGLGVLPAATAQQCSGAQCQGGGTVGASLTIPVSFAFTLNTTAITFTGTPGGPSSVAAVDWSVTTNDPSGWSTTVAASGPNFAGTANPSSTFPVGDVTVWGAAQAIPSGHVAEAAPVGMHYPVPLSTTPLVTGSATSAVSASFTDSYAFLGSGCGSGCVWTTSTGATVPTSPIPAAAPDTYTATLDYLALAG